MRSKIMEEERLYNRMFSHAVHGKGVKIHIEVFVEKWEDAVREVYQYAQAIKDEYERHGRYYEDPFGEKGKLNQVALREETKITERFG